MYHFAETHVDIGIDDTLPKIPGELLVDAFITSEEERLIGNRGKFDRRVQEGESDSRSRWNAGATRGAEKN
jgi:hypothetical protein